MLTIEGVDQFYGESQTLWNLSMVVPKGSCTCLMGRNGVGKTTTLKVVMGLLPIRKGSVQYQGQNMSERPAEARAGSGIAFVPQGRHIFARLTVEENLKIALVTNRGARGRLAYERVIDTFPVLRTMLHRYGGDLSGGQQQQLAVGRALILEPELLVLDEPTEGIQPNVVQEIGDTIVRLNKQEGLTVLLVEQKLPLARRVADRFYILDKGRTMSEGGMDQLSDDIVSRFLTV
jgi:urea transport system ATP-binding protein